MANYYNKDLYKILNVDYNATDEEIKLSYRNLVRTYHPDVAGKTIDSSVFKEIQEAYEVLKDKESRKKYDILRGYYTEKIKKEFEENAKKKQKEKYDEYVKKAKNNSSKSASFSDSINEALDSLFYSTKSTHKSNKTKPPINGSDINIDLSISCFEALYGTSRKVNILHTQPCPNCDGRTFINGSVCVMCNGSGQLSLQKKINVKIPKGVTQGSKVRVKKEGNKGINGGKDGDLYLIINIEKNKYFEIEGMNILCNLPVTPYEAALGAEIPITIMKETINVKIPPLTSSGQKLRLAGLGLDNKSKTKKGDLIITVIIKFPDSVSQKEKDLYSKLRDISKNDIRKDMSDESK